MKWGGEVVTPLEANRPVIVGGVLIRPGDHVFAATSGAVVTPQARVVQVLEDAHRVAQDDMTASDTIRHGENTA